MRRYRAVEKSRRTIGIFAVTACNLAICKRRIEYSGEAERHSGIKVNATNRAKIAVAAKALFITQLSDGSFKQLPTMGSDAYATGQALYALSAGGQMPASDPIYVKGVKYLLNTQAADGSWHVKSRSIWLQLYFDSGFPYAQDQWISAAGIAWATMALSMAADPQHNAADGNTRVALLR